MKIEQLIYFAQNTLLKNFLAKTTVLWEIASVTESMTAHTHTHARALARTRTHLHACVYTRTYLGIRFMDKLKTYTT